MIVLTIIVQKLYKNGNQSNAYHYCFFSFKEFLMYLLNLEILVHFRNPQDTWKLMYFWSFPCISEIFPIFEKFSL